MVESFFYFFLVRGLVKVLVVRLREFKIFFSWEEVFILMRRDFLLVWLFGELEVMFLVGGFWEVIRFLEEKNLVRMVGIIFVIDFFICLFNFGDVIFVVWIGVDLFILF